MAKGNVIEMNLSLLELQVVGALCNLLFGHKHLIEILDVDSCLGVQPHLPALPVKEFS